MQDNEFLKSGEEIGDSPVPRFKRLTGGADRLRSCLALAVFLGAMICFTAIAGADDDFTPWDFARPKMTRADTAKELSGPASLLKMGSLFFSKYISPVDGDRCPMYPTCSAYSRDALEKHGFAGGVLLTVDRLIHESDEMSRAPRIMIFGHLRFLDPVSNNDFWWYK